MVWCDVVCVYVCGVCGVRYMCVWCGVMCACVCCMRVV